MFFRCPCFCSLEQKTSKHELMQEGIGKRADALCQVPPSIAEGHRDRMMTTPTNVFLTNHCASTPLSRFCLQTIFLPRFLTEATSPPSFLLQTTSPPSSVAVLFVDHLPTRASPRINLPTNLRPRKGAWGGTTGWCRENNFLGEVRRNNEANQNTISTLRFAAA